MKNNFLIILVTVFQICKSNIDIEEEIDWDKIETVDYKQQKNQKEDSKTETGNDVIEEFMKNEFQQKNEQQNNNKNEKPVESKDIEALEKQLDLLQKFSCYMAVQKQLKNYEEDIKAMSKNMHAKTSFQKVVSNLFSLCLDNISVEQQKEVLQTNNQEDFAKLKFEFFDNYDVSEVMSNTNQSMTENEAKFYNLYTQLEEEMAKLKQEAKEQIEKKQNKNNNSEQRYQQSNNFQGANQLNIFGFTFQNINPLCVVFPIIFVIVLIFRQMWNGIFQVKNTPKKKKDKKKKKN